MLRQSNDNLRRAEAERLLFAAVEGVYKPLQHFELEHDPCNKLCSGIRQWHAREALQGKPTVLRKAKKNVKECVLRFVAVQVIDFKEEVCQALQGGSGKLVLVLTVRVDHGLHCGEGPFQQLRPLLQATG